METTPWVEAYSAKKKPKESRLCRGFDTISSRVEEIQIKQKKEQRK